MKLSPVYVTQGRSEIKGINFMETKNIEVFIREVFPTYLLNDCRTYALLVSSFDLIRR